MERECDESTRNFIRKIKASRIRDVKSELTTQMKGELNNRFNKLGVYIERIDIMNVIIPRDLRMCLSQATAFDVML